jgi:hypothetical protein
VDYNTLFFFRQRLRVRFILSRQKNTKQNYERRGWKTIRPRVPKHRLASRFCLCFLKAARQPQL